MILLENLNVRDPYVYYEGGYYYLYSSRTVCGGERPAFVCHKSKDLKTFGEPVSLFEPDGDFWATKDFWAPEMHPYKGKYYLFGTLKSDTHTRGTQIFVSDTPDGEYKPLSEYPVTPNDWECLDGTLFVENDVPYMIFCREWLEIVDGEIYIMQLTPDLKEAASEPVKLFSASTVKWTRPLGENNYVTDGPFVIKHNGKYNMIWSSFSEKGYAMGVCRSKSLFGPWEHESAPINYNDGGHGMVFCKDNKNYLVYHAPNDPAGAERMQLVPYEIN